MQKSGFALGFFANLRNAIYGEQEKEAMSFKKATKPKKHMKKAKLGILARIHSLILHHILCKYHLIEI